MSEKKKSESKKRKDESSTLKPKRKKGSELKNTENQSAPTESTDPANGSFDFGGLPERSLKKNLGCG